MRPTVKDIQMVVSRHYRVPHHELLAGRQQHPVVHARQIGMYLARQLTLRSLPDIGKRFGGRDHTTVLHACRKIEARIRDDQDLAGELALLQAQIELSTKQEIASATGAAVDREVLAVRAVDLVAEKISAQVAARLVEAVAGQLAQATLAVSVPSAPPELTALLAAVDAMECERYGRHEAKAIDKVIAAARAARKAGLQ